MRRRRDDYLKQLAAVPMFKACTSRELIEIGRRAEDIEFAAGTVIVAEGTPSDAFYVIVGGKAKVSRKGKKVAELGAGDFFGELGLLARLPRDATVTAIGPVEVVAISRREFTTVLEDVPSVTRKLLEGMAKRLHELDRRG
ncbi:MAG TPA: cyclic nucleotide-binding domain-containing protein [Acidimicrobiales bacterium]|jgi:CRP/FNR family cyclic AMP-dependent transcriptional regulator|nr:cyclic nucleotide-binding domain-containing protein [Acidimicrobiales bacterium]